MKWSEWNENAIVALRGLRGDGRAGSDGRILPLLHAGDGIAVLGQLAPGVVGALNAFSRQVNNEAISQLGMIMSGNLQNGILEVDPIALSQLADSDSWLRTVDYVAGIGQPDAPWRRSKAIGGATYEPFIIHNTLAEDEDHLLGFVRQLMSDWQRAVDAEAAILSSSPSSNDVADVFQVATFYQRVSSVCSSLEVLGENPPMSASDKIKAAALTAVHQTEEWAGKAAADVANEAGQLAGNVSAGFFAEAGVTSLIVAGIAVWLFVK